MPISGFLQGLGQQAGYSVMYGLEKRAADQTAELRQQRIEAGRAEAVDRQRQQESRMATMTELKTTVLEGKGAAEQANALRKARFSAFANNDLSAVPALTAMITDSEKEVDRLKADTIDKTRLLKETTANTAADYLATKTPEAATALVQDYLAAGGDPRLIPPPGEKFDAWAEQRKFDGVSGSKKAEFLATLDERKREADMKDQNAKIAQSNLAESRRMTAVTQQMGLQLRKAMLEQQAPPVATKEDRALIESDAARIVAGEKVSEVIPGTGRSVVARRAAAERAAVRQIMEENPDMTAKEAGRLLSQREIERAGERSGVTAYERTAGQASAKVAMAASEAVKMGDLMLSIAPQIGSTQYPSMNKIVNAMKRGTGDPTITALDQSMDSFVNEYARAIYGTGGGALADREHARDRLNSALAQGQIKSVTKVMMREMELAQEAAHGERGRGRSTAPAATVPTATGLPAGWK